MRIFPSVVLIVLAATLNAQQPPKVDAAAKPDNTARQAVIESLDKLAAQQTAARRTEIAKIKTADAASARQAQVRATMLRLLGPLPARTPLNPQVLGETQLAGVRLTKILYDSQPGFHVTAILYLPDPLPVAKLPAIVVAPGHGANGKASDFASAMTFARAGFAVLSYDPIGQGERLQYPDPADPARSLATRPTGEHSEASLQPILIGESLGKYMLWDGMRAVDYLETRPEVDAKRIGAFGCSGGGAMTALLGALDIRIAATGTACYTTSFDTLLPAIGPQDGEQSTPGWIASGLDFPDWIEVAAPRPYAIIATESDMFPFTGAQATEAEARGFYAQLHAEQNLAFIHGPGGHGNLRPIFAQILGFFAEHLHPVAPSQSEQGSVQLKDLPAGALQVTATGQVSTSYPNAATVFSLNMAEARRVVPRQTKRADYSALVRQITGASAIPGDPSPTSTPASPSDVAHIRHRMKIDTAPGIQVEAEFYRPASEGKHPTRLFLRNSLDASLEASRAKEIESFTAMATSGTAVVVLAPRPSPAGSEEAKSSLLGPDYLLGLRAQLVGKTLLGLRVNDVIAYIDFFSTGATEDPNNITAEASGHEALVLLHAAILDPRLKHITLHDLPPTYAETLANPLPRDLSEDMLPGVLLQYDIPDLIRALGPRVTVVAPDNSATGNHL